MNYRYLLSIALLSVIIACQTDPQDNQVYEVELELEEFDYFEDSIPYHGNSYASGSNVDEEAALGRLLFYDARLSQNNSIACASCHKQSIGFSDNKKFSEGLENYKTRRNAMSLVNNAYQISHFWEGHTGELHDHILNPVSNHIEMGMKSVEELTEKLSGIPAYNDLFLEVYGAEVDEELINDALSTFVASIISYSSKFDKGTEIEFANFTNAELAGKELFFGKANCDNCHRGNHFAASWRSATNIGLDINYSDQGAGEGKFKVPSLRNIAITGPYMHDGRFETLEEVVDHYSEGVQDHPQLDWILGGDISLTDTEKSDLVEFLHTLTDYTLISDKKFSNPF